jgi:integrase
MQNVVPLRKPVHETWEDALEAFLLWRTATGLSERTLKDYRVHVARFFTRYPEAWGTSTLNACVYRYLGENVAPATFNIRRKYLKVFFDWAREEGVIHQNPIEGIKARHAEPRIVRIAPNVLQRLLDLPDTGTFAGLRDKALLLLQLDTGIRPGEALQLYPCDFNPAGFEVHIRPEVSKTRRARTLVISRICSQAISRLLAVRPETWQGSPIFCSDDGEPYRINSWGYRLKKVYGKRLGVKISPYDLRHCHAIMFLRNNGNLFALQREMGHSNLDMTKRYLALSDDDLREAHSKASPLNSLLKTEGKPRLRSLKRGDARR